MKEIHLNFTNPRAWLVVALIVLGIMFGYWVSGTWPSNPSFEYVPPKFDELQVTQGKLSFTRRSKSSGGEIELLLESGEKLRLACNPPNTLPDACYYKKETCIFPSVVISYYHTSRRKLVSELKALTLPRRSSPSSHLQRQHGH